MRGLTTCIGALTGAVVMACAILPASATIRITGDPGGQIGPYLENLASIRSSGEHVVIDGPCLSACTMVLGVIPRDHLCVTPRARLGFHTAWRPDGVTGRPVVSRDGTQLLMEVYPRPVRHWIARRGGLTPHMMFLSGRELESMYPACHGDSEARN
ncbi:MAG TPA: hypothetical protein VKW08_15835 [Xanthobacteraceae bacterium]|jgi:hypothetical protein|nr:hypothetical protein [Xanthobacteraceae bacterium]